MDWNKYQELAFRTASGFPGLKEMWLCGAIGLAGETGEICDHVKKWLFHRHELDKIKVKEELGDVLWYVALIATAAGLDLESVASGNIEKLKKRYPDGFTTEQSIKREDKLDG